MQLTFLPTLLLCLVVKLQQLVKLSGYGSVNCLAISVPNLTLSPHPPMVVVESIILFLTEKSQPQADNSCSLHFLATSRAIPALIMELRKAVSRVPTLYVGVRLLCLHNLRLKKWDNSTNATLQSYMRSQVSENNRDSYS